jgi:hypothetical protein
MTTAFIYILITIGVVALCWLGMSIGLIFRGKTFTSCGRAARDFDGQPIECAACGQKVRAEGKACKRPAEAKS